MLTALRIDHELERRDETYTLVVAPENETRARIELTEYESELADASRSAETRSPTRAGGPRDALG